ncbi:uncharacterized protein LOC111717889, partial [Eurytemora carolleeae]|uniref:uncharacterized protein LOC111717889 n=1 Tax=Eurytemora carolleeae TaxID=1294199 RepID=UPI000C78D1B4
MYQLLVLVAYLACTTGLSVHEYSKHQLVEPGEAVKLYCSADDDVDICQWSLGEETCKVLKNSENEDCMDGVSATLENNRCTLSFESVSEEEGSMDFNCLFVQVRDTVVQASQDLSFAVAVPATLTSSLEQEKMMINILEGTDYTWRCDSDGGTPPANISGFLGLQVLQGVQGEYTIRPGK